MYQASDAAEESLAAVAGMFNSKAKGGGPVFDFIMKAISVYLFACCPVTHLFL